MGGNALKNCVTRKFQSDEYFKLESEMMGKLKLLFPESQFATIKAYSEKESYGDMDILVDSENLPSNWVFQVCQSFNTKGFVKNGNVLSFEYKECQVDLIVTDPSDMQSSFQYFSYNDLGNLIGRVAHCMGLKLGHDGLTYKYMGAERYVFKEIELLKNWKDILPVLGYNYERYEKGFNTLQDIFEFVVSSPFFNKSIYALENRNNAARTRDAKRKTYTDFLLWLEGYRHTVPQQHRLEYTESDSYEKSQWLPYIFQQVGCFEDQYRAAEKEYQNAQEYKRRFNGTLVTQWTGLKEKQLGEFMKWLKAQADDVRWKKDIVSLNPDLVEGLVVYYFEKWNKENGCPQLQRNMELI